MYFPYLRGKQFELIALREGSGMLAKNKTKVSPIIEPVKDSTTFKTTINDLKNKNVNFTVIINPKVGDLQGSTSSILTILSKELSGYKNFQLGIILSGKENHKNLITTLKKFDLILHGLTLIHNATYENIDDIVSDYSSAIPVKYNVVHFGKTSRRYYRNFDSSTIVELDDYFSSQQKNSDYKHYDESDFSEEHIFYKKDGFVGFSDFLTIGDNYSESGFLPYAVAIHLSYSDSTDKIKVKHFVSDSNDDTSDVAGKFEEALEKLVSWCIAEKFKTSAVDSFKELYDSGHFPGLGTIKKLSILNHIEVVLKLI
ncbi:MAG: sce7725 family protein [Ferruginibacter sp.]